MKAKTLNADVAIIGMAGKFPGASDVNVFWSNISNKIASVLQFSDDELAASGIAPELLKNPNYVKAKGYLENADYFDADFFRFSKYEAEILDPQYRLFFEVVWEALENAAYIPDNYPAKISVFTGSSNIDNYYLHNLMRASNSVLLTDNFTITLHNAKDFLSSLIAYKLNLRGPAITVQTACSTSLVAVCMACQNLLNGESDLAIAGGTCVTMPLKSGYLFQNGMMLSPTGKCSAFDKNADGTVLGNGLGAVVLKRLDDALTDGDHIHAVIKGFSINNDGGNKIGFTAPNMSSQQMVILDALNRANISPEMISYIETHGTGTILGDLIEMEALANVFKNCTNPIALGSVKPNIGHLDAASGVASLIKVIQALKHRILPPNINFSVPSPQIDMSDKPFYINTHSKAWMSANSQRYAGVSSFGMGGTNVHMILTEAPEVSLPKQKNNFSEPVLIVLSAKTHTALVQMKENLRIFLNSNPDINLADLAYTLQVGRRQLKHRVAYICDTVEDIIYHLRSCDNLPDLDSASKSEQLATIALQWLKGQEIDWQILHGTTKRRRIPLPTYPFERKKYWTSRDTLILPAFKSVTPEVINKTQSFTRIEAIEKTVKEIFERFLAQKNIDVTKNFNNLGGDSLVALLITHEISKSLGLKLPFSIFSNDLSVRTLSENIANHIENQ